MGREVPRAKAEKAKISKTKRLDLPIKYDKLIFLAGEVVRVEAEKTNILNLTQETTNNH